MASINIDLTSTTQVQDIDIEVAQTQELLDVNLGSGVVFPTGLQNLNLDAFARLRISTPQTIFDSKQIADNQPLFWDDAATSGAGTSSTFVANTASTVMGVSANTAGQRVRQTFRRFNYQPGKSQLWILTGILGTPATGITRRLGMFTSNNGMYFESNGTSLAVAVRSNTTGTPVNNTIAQANWNIDKMDGTGTSGLTLDSSKTLIYFCDFEWLGVGTVRMGVFINGLPYYVHAFNHSNFLTEVYMSTPNLPLRYEITNDGTGGAATLTHICATVITEGGRQDTGVLRGINRAGVPLVTLNNDAIYPLVGIRIKETNLGAFVRYFDQSIICSSAAEYAFYVIQKPTVVGTAPTWIPLDNSSVEYCIPTSATTITGGTVIYTGIGSDTSQTRGGAVRIISSDLIIGSSINGTREELYLGIQRLTGTTETFYASINFSETN